MKRVKQILMSAVLTTAVCCIFTTGANAAPCKDKLFEAKQPDGSKVQVKVTGDEYYQQVESLDGYTLCTDKAGWICYAKLNEDQSELISTGEIYKGKNNTKTMDSAAKAGTNSNATKHLKISKKAKEEKKNIVKKSLKVDDSTNEANLDAKNSFMYANGLTNTEVSNGLLESKISNGFLAANTLVSQENVKGLTILIDFPDVKSSISKEEINNFFNLQGYTGFGNNGSIRDYFYDVSGGKLLYTNSVIGFYTAKYPKAYYDDIYASAGDYSKAVELATEAANWARATGFDFSTLTEDQYGYAKAVNILYAGNADSPWGKGIWPHQGELRNTGEIRRYEMSNIGSDLAIDTICHENGHLICNYPDLYDYDGDSQGTGGYSLMSGTSNPKNPAPPDPYCRNIISGWNTTTDLNTYNNGSIITALSNGNANQQIYKWAGNNSEEYYLVENIKKVGRYANVPDEGLAVWHVDQSGDNSYNDMRADRHYLVSLVQADGKFDMEYNRNGGYDGDLFHGGYNTAINDTSMPNSKWWNGTASGLDISKISNLGSTMTFVKSGTTTTPIIENLAKYATPSTSYCSPWENINALNDGIEPTNSNDRSAAVYGNWVGNAASNRVVWVQYDFNTSYKISSCDLYWFKDNQGIDVPSSYKIKYWNGTSWVSVSNTNGLGTEINKYNTTTFDPISTNKIRIEVTAKGTYSTGILEWKVK